MKGFFEKVFWFFEGSNLFAFICLTLGVLVGIYAYALPDGEAVWETSLYAMAAVLAVLGVSMYVYRFFDDGTGGRRLAR